MESLAPFHPQIVHTPIVLIIVSLLFELIGRATDLDWWRKASFALLILGVMGAGAALLSGEPAADHAARLQGVPREAIEAHEDMGKLTFWLALGAVVLRASVAFAGKARAFAAALALTMHLAAAVTVGWAAHRGGRLVFEHAAAVRVNGKLVPAGPLPHH
jgi:uncharacterized membrane protein